MRASSFLAVIGIRIVPEGEAWIVERLGKYSRTLHAGLRFTIPLLEWVAYRLPTREQVIDKITFTTLTKNSIPITLETTLYYRIVDFKKAAYGVELRDGRPEFALLQLSQATMRSVSGERDFDTMLDNQKDVNREIRANMATAVEPWGTEITRHEILDLIAPPDIREALLQQLTAEKAKLAEIARAEGEARAQVIRSEAKREETINLAQGEREAAILKAKAEAEAREREAESKAKVLDALTARFNNDPAAAANYLLAEEQYAAISALATSKGMILLPAGTEGIAGIMAMFKGLSGGIVSTK